MLTLDELPFTEKSLAKAKEYGHTAEMYEGIEPQSNAGKFLVTQVEEVEMKRNEPPDDLEPIDAGDWNGYQNWGCPYCDKVSLDRNLVREHALRAHSRA